MEISKINIATSSAKDDSTKVAILFPREVFIADPSCWHGRHLFELFSLRYLSARNWCFLLLGYSFGMTEGRRT